MTSFVGFHPICSIMYDLPVFKARRLFEEKFGMYNSGKCALTDPFYFSRIYLIEMNILFA